MIREKLIKAAVDLAAYATIIPAWKRYVDEVVILRHKRRKFIPSFKHVGTSAEKQ